MGGRTFIKDGVNPVERIPEVLIEPLSAVFLEKYKHFFKKIELVTHTEILSKPTHGDIDFVCTFLPPNGFDEFVKELDFLGIQHKKNGNMFHVAYPFGNVKYQIDLIMCGIANYDTFVFFYSKPLVWNAVVGHFARSLGYRFSTTGILLHFTDARKRNYYMRLTRNLDKCFDLLGLEKREGLDLYNSPESFANWIMSSPRFDTKRFGNSGNKNSHRDAKNNDFCFHVYQLLENSDITASMPPSIADLSLPEFDINKAFAHEENVLGPEIRGKIIRFNEWVSRVANPIISGDTLLEMGYKPGPLFGTIIQDVSNRFTRSDSIDDIKEYISTNYNI